MSTILDNIILAKRSELKGLKEQVSIKELEKSQLFDKERPSFYNSLSAGAYGLIAEFKRSSPSKGDINPAAKPEVVV